jgi:hypothetical protein
MIFENRQNQYHSKFLANIVGIIWYHQVIARTPKNILTIQFLMVISQYFTLLVSDCQYLVSNQIISESKCLKFSRCHTFDALYKPESQILCSKAKLEPTKVEPLTGFLSEDCQALPANIILGWTTTLVGAVEPSGQ